MTKVVLVRPLRNQVSYVKDQNKTARLDTPSPSPSKEGRRGGGNTQPVDGVGKQASVEQILALAQLLTPSERKELVARLALEAQTLPEGQTRDVAMWAHAVYTALVAAIGGGGEGLQGPMVVKRIVGVPSAWGPVQSFMKASKMDALSVTERQSVYLLLAKLVVDSARYVSRTQHIPLGVKLVASCASNITGIFGQSFPGYLESGLAPMIARTLRAH